MLRRFEERRSIEYRRSFFSPKQVLLISFRRSCVFFDIDVSEDDCGWAVNKKRRAAEKKLAIAMIFRKRISYGVALRA
jgi:hypothetical protein